MFKFNNSGVYGIDDLHWDDFVLMALQAKVFEIKGVEYNLSHNVKEGFNLTWDNGMDLGDEYLSGILDLVYHLHELYNDATYMSPEEIKEALIAKEDQCDRVMLASLWCTIGYINCGLDLGKDFTEEEVAAFRNQLKEI